MNYLQIIETMRENDYSSKMKKIFYDIVKNNKLKFEYSYDNNENNRDYIIGIFNGNVSVKIKDVQDYDGMLFTMVSAIIQKLELEYPGKQLSNIDFWICGESGKTDDDLSKKDNIEVSPTFHVKKLL